VSTADGYPSRAFHELLDEQGTLQAIYELAGQPFDDGVRAAMKRFIATHPRGRHGDVVYDLSAVGLDAEDVARRLAGYRRRFVDT